MLNKNDHLSRNDKTIEGIATYGKHIETADNTLRFS